MSKSGNTIRRGRHRERFDERVAIFVEELELARQWQRPSILLAVYRSEFVRARAEAALEKCLLEIGQVVYRLEISEELFDIALILSQHPDREQRVYFITGFKWGGGREGLNAYRALNLRREFFVENRIRAVFWLAESEANILPRYAPDFWAFRHRVVEFVESPVRKHIVSLAEVRDWRDRNRRVSHDDVDKEIALRERLLADLPHGVESQAARADLFYNLASLYAIKGENKQSMDLLKRGLEIAQWLQVPVMQSRFWGGLGIIYHNLNHFDEAVNAYQRAIEYNPKDSVIWAHLSDVYRDQGRMQDAINACKKAINLDPKDAGPWNNLGNVYFAQGRNDDAIRAYQKAIDLSPKDARPWNNIGNVYRQQGRSKDAIHACQEAIKLNPLDVEPWNNLGNVYFGEGCNDDAIRAFNRATKIDPKDEKSWNNLGIVYSHLGRTKDAIGAFRKATKLNPEDVESWSKLGQVYRVIDRIPDAIIAYKKAVALNPKEATFYIALAACYQKSGFADKAAEQIKIARPLMKKESEYNRAGLEAVCGNADKAIFLLKIALEKKQTALDRIRHDPNFYFIWYAPRFRELVGRE